jgi:hypothetical protein
MSIKKLMSILAMLTISILCFTACEDTDDPVDPGPDVTKNPPAAVTNMYAGAISETAIQVQWDAVTAVSGVTVLNYRLIVTGGSVNDTIVRPIDSLYYTLNNCVLGTEYTFTVCAVSTDNLSGATKSIKWATSKHFTLNENDSPIYVYGSNTTDYGSGLQLYGPNDAPRIRKVANAADAAECNLGLYTKDSKVIFGSASALGYNAAFPASAIITDPIDFDTDNLSNPLLGNSLANMSFSSKTIDLKTAGASNSKGIVFFAKVGTNYAKIVILKKGGAFLQNAGTINEYVQVLVSYQTAAGVPYAKIFAGK